MKKNIISILTGIMVSGVLACPLCHRPLQENTYPVLLQVTAVQGLGHDDASDIHDGYLVCLKNAHGFVYRVHMEDGDMELGDYYSCIMSDNGTPQIMDDIVIDYKYERPDLFGDIYNN